MGSDFGGGMFTGPHMRALGMKAYIDDIKFKREAREQQRQQWKMDMENAQRGRQMEDLKTTMALRSMGAVGQGANDQSVEQALTGAFGATTPDSTRMPVKTPVGDYYLPSRADERGRMETEAVQAGTAKGKGQLAYLDVTDPLEEIEVPGVGKGNVRQSKKLDVLINAYSKTHPNWSFDREVNDRGDMTIVGTHPQTGETKVFKTLPGIGKTKAAGAGREPLPDNSAIEGIYKKYLPNVYNDEGITQQDFDHALGNFGEAILLPEEQMKLRKTAQDRIAGAKKKAWDAATDQAKAQIRNSGTSADQAAEAGMEATATKTPGQLPKQIKASSLDDLLRRTRAKGEPGLTMNELRKRLGGKQVEILED